eukprot:scaffold8055_cov403-Prasinococcus_capsulatus_cf.AAC.2
MVVDSIRNTLNQFPRDGRRFILDPSAHGCHLLNKKPKQWRWNAANGICHHRNVRSLMWPNVRWRNDNEHAAIGFCTLAANILVNMMLTRCEFISHHTAGLEQSTTLFFIALQLLVLPFHFAHLFFILPQPVLSLRQLEFVVL